MKQESHPIHIPPIMSYASDAGGLAHISCPAASIHTAEIPDQVRNDDIKKCVIGAFSVPMTHFSFDASKRDEI